jgi:hypothetical protein
LHTQGRGALYLYGKACGYITIKKLRA